MMLASGKIITTADINQMVLDQNNKCAICQDVMKKPCVDHNHNTGLVRKLLCSHCNSVLGMAKDNIQVLENAIEYLKSHS
jgi:hypothetical protein